MLTVVQADSAAPVATSTKRKIRGSLALAGPYMVDLDDRAHEVRIVRNDSDEPLILLLLALDPVRVGGSPTANVASATAGETLLIR